MSINLIETSQVVQPIIEHYSHSIQPSKQAILKSYLLDAKLDPISDALFKKTNKLAESFSTKSMHDLKRVQRLSEILIFIKDDLARQVYIYILSEVIARDPTFSSDSNISALAYNEYLEDELFCNLLSFEAKTSSEAVAARVFKKVLAYEGMDALHKLENPISKYEELLNAFIYLNMDVIEYLMLFIYIKKTIKIYNENK